MKKNRTFWTAALVMTAALSATTYAQSKTVNLQIGNAQMTVNGEVSELLHEMATNGISMAVLVTAVWGVMVGISSYKEKRTKDSASSNAATACNAAAGMTGSPA